MLTSLAEKKSIVIIEGEPRHAYISLTSVSVLNIAVTLGNFERFKSSIASCLMMGEGLLVKGCREGRRGAGRAPNLVTRTTRLSNSHFI